MPPLIYQGHEFKVLPSWRQPLRGGCLGVTMKGKYIHRVVALMAWPFNDISFYEKREYNELFFISHYEW